MRGNLLLSTPYDSPEPPRFPVDQSRHEEKSVTPVTPAAAQPEKELLLPTEIRARIMATCVMRRRVEPNLIP